MLGEMRRQMNGAVVGAMRFYGAEYGLNYGVSLPTIRSIAKEEALLVDDIVESHRFAKLLYRQDVRELRLASFWFADPEKVCDEMEFWGGGIINSEVAEEAAFVLLHRCECVDAWLMGEGELLQYCALMSIAKRSDIDLDRYSSRIGELLQGDVHILPSAVVALLDTVIRQSSDLSNVERLITSLPADTRGAEFIRDEVSWRLEFR